MDFVVIPTFFLFKGDGKAAIRTEMKTITFFHSDTNDKKVFAFKAMGGTSDPKVQMCHVFKAPSKSKVSGQDIKKGWSFHFLFPVHVFFFFTALLLMITMSSRVSPNIKPRPLLHLLIATSYVILF